LDKNTELGSILLLDVNLHKKAKGAIIMYQAINYAYLLGIPGLSNQLLTNHFTLYQGYVTNTNKLLEILQGYLATNEVTTPQYAGLKRHFGWEFNGMRLHELYFSNLTKSNMMLKEDSPLAVAIKKDFGSIEKWQEDFKATGNIRGIGWSVLCYDIIGKQLIDVWVNEHNLNTLLFCQPLLVMDVWEHAYTLDYGIQRPDYINAFFKIINWDIVEQRFKVVSLSIPS
jgi:Fe-Mn family superoxide dismutase